MNGFPYGRAILTACTLREFRLTIDVLRRILCISYSPVAPAMIIRPRIFVRLIFIGNSVCPTFFHRAERISA